MYSGNMNASSQGEGQEKNFVGKSEGGNECGFDR